MWHSNSSVWRIWGDKKLVEWVIFAFLSPDLFSQDPSQKENKSENKIKGFERMRSATMASFFANPRLPNFTVGSLRTGPTVSKLRRAPEIYRNRQRHCESKAPSKLETIFAVTFRLQQSHAYLDYNYKNTMSTIRSLDDKVELPPLMDPTKLLVRLVRKRSTRSITTMMWLWRLFLFTSFHVARPSSPSVTRMEGKSLCHSWGTFSWIAKCFKCRPKTYLLAM